MNYNLEFFSLGFSCAALLIMGTHFLKHGVIRIKRMVGLILLLWAALDIKDLILYNIGFLDNRELMLFLQSLDLIVAPTCVFVIHEFARPHWFNLKKALWHGIPFMLLVALCTLSHNNAAYLLSIAYGLVYVIYNCILFFKEKRRYDISVAEEYSYSEGLNLKWLGRCTIAYFLLQLLWAFSFLFQNCVFDSLYYILSSFLWLRICIYVEKQQIPADLITEKDEYEMFSDAITDDMKRNFETSLNELFVEKEIYKNQCLTINDVASELGTNRTYISSYINQSLQTTFIDFVNQFRVAHATELLLTTDHTLPNICELSGFRSLSTFHRVFLKFNHCTPQQYRNQQRKAL
jgi:AraC-like DNA-binding protein